MLSDRDVNGAFASGWAGVAAGVFGLIIGIAFGRISTTLAECVCATVFQGFVFGNTGTVEAAAEG